MGFYGKEPIDASKCKVSYLWTGFGVPGTFVVEVEGQAPNYSYGFELVRDPNFVGGLKIDAMGWTGPLGQGTTPYTCNGSFPGQFLPKVVISGSNGDFVLNVIEISHDQVDSFIRCCADSARAKAAALSSLPVSVQATFVPAAASAGHGPVASASYVASAAHIPAGLQGAVAYGPVAGVSAPQASVFGYGPAACSAPEAGFTVYGPVASSVPGVYGPVACAPQACGPVVFGPAIYGPAVGKAA